MSEESSHALAQFSCAKFNLLITFCEFLAWRHKAEFDSISYCLFVFIPIQ